MADKEKSLKINPQTEQCKLSSGQKKFNSLIGRIDKQRRLLEAWQAAIPAYQQRWSDTFKPLLDDYRQQQTELLEFLDQTSGRVKLAKAERETLRDTICDLVTQLLESADDPAALKALYQKHSGVDYDHQQRHDEETFKEVLETLFGIKDQEDELLQPGAPDFMERMAEQLQASGGSTDQRQADKPSARQRRQEEEARQASQSVREIYRKLASSLHPDRETDTAERQRKTAQMQRANQAYKAGNLLELLQLQLEIEQIDQHRLDNLAEDRLKHYNRMLANQLAELQHEVRAEEQAFRMRFVIQSSAAVSPTRLTRKIDMQIRHLRDDIQHLKLERQALENPQALKQWLKEQRQHNLDDARFFEELLLR
ncbi:molecular chaperone DnaJ [Azomonas macrocytogenes]|uniref:Molecular chaperone DnaJ n=1 Tax=Azomonas macrocytogenes TaxID=69962 RepID=A0A839T513_AZOMA|nr:molecular chaperone DnaJ [Azomonas macrocytogenes]MBB3103860.1 hypothetical protein [Azomonas macrocytogenes]